VAPPPVHFVLFNRLLYTINIAVLPEIEESGKRPTGGRYATKVNADALYVVPSTFALDQI
jgi:hypothetical protein